ETVMPTGWTLGDQAGIGGASPHSRAVGDAAMPIGPHPAAAGAMRPNLILGAAVREAPTVSPAGDGPVRPDPAGPPPAPARRVRGRDRAAGSAPRRVLWGLTPPHLTGRGNARLRGGSSGPGPLGDRSGDPHDPGPRSGRARFARAPNAVDPDGRGRSRFSG